MDAQGSKDAGWEKNNARIRKDEAVLNTVRMSEPADRIQKAEAFGHATAALSASGLEPETYGLKVRCSTD